MQAQLRYYSGRAVHRAAFVLPAFAESALAPMWVRGGGVCSCGVYVAAAAAAVIVVAAAAAAAAAVALAGDDVHSDERKGGRER